MKTRNRLAEEIRARAVTWRQARTQVVAARDDLTGTILVFLDQGGSKSEAARLAGVSRTVLDTWLRKEEQG